MNRLLHLARITGMASAFSMGQMFCFSKETDFPFIEVVQYNANNPIEDRFSYAKLKSISGFTASVFDGHGGDLVVTILTNRLNTFLKI